MRESALQASIAQYLSLALPREAFYFHPANEGRRGFVAQREFKAFGGKAGVPDICIVYGGRAFWIELKAPKKYLSPAQKQVHRELRNAGCDVVVARSLAEVMLACEAWNIPISARVGA